MRIWNLIVFCLLFLLFSVPLQAQQQEEESDEIHYGELRESTFSVQVGAWEERINGSAILEDSATNDDEFHLRDDLNLDDNTGLRFRSEYQFLNRHFLRFGYSGMDFGSNATLERDLTIGGQTFTQSEDVRSEFTLNAWEAGYRYDLVRGDRFTLSPMFRLQVMDFEGHVESRDNNRESRESGTVPVPLPGFRGEVAPLHRMQLYGEINYMDVSSSDRGGTLLDWEAGTSVHIMRNLTVKGGYRSMDVDVEVDSLQLDADVQGWFLTVGTTF